MPRLFTALLALVAFCSPGQAQDPARGKLYTKTVGETVHAVIELRVDQGWHIYDPDLGPPDAVGKPTEVTLSGGGLSFGEPRFPEPERHEEPALGTWANVHYGKILVRT